MLSPHIYHLSAFSWTVFLTDLWWIGVVGLEVENHWISETRLGIEKIGNPVPVAIETGTMDEAPRRTVCVAVKLVGAQGVEWYYMEGLVQWQVQRADNVVVVETAVASFDGEVGVVATNENRTFGLAAAGSGVVECDDRDVVVAVKRQELLVDSDWVAVRDNEVWMMKGCIGRNHGVFHTVIAVDAADLVAVEHDPWEDRMV